MKKSIFDLQIFADGEGAAAAAEPVTAEGNDNKAAAEQDKATKEPKGGKGELKYSDADLDEIINRKFAKWEQKKQKEVDEAAKLAAMDEQQKAEYQRDELQKELDALKKEKALSDMTKTARKMLADKNISAPDELLAMLVTTDANETKAAIDSFAKLLNETVENAVKSRLRGEVPKTGTGASAPISEIDKRIKKYQ